MLIQPGRAGVDGSAGGTVPARNATATEAVVSLVYSLVPDNLVGAAASMDMLGLITFSVAVGLAALQLGEAGARLLQWVGDVNDVTYAAISARIAECNKAIAA